MSSGPAGVPGTVCRSSIRAVVASMFSPNWLNIATRTPAPIVRLSHDDHVPGRDALPSNQVTTPA